MLTCDANHVYRDERGVIIPGVTSILDAEGFVDFSMVPEYLMDSAQSFGSNVHIGCELADKGTLDYETLDPALLPYVQGWRKFLADCQAEVVEIETLVHSKIWGFCGRLDRILKINGHLGIYDLKTGNGCSLQTAAYKIAYEEQAGIKLKDRANVKLTGDGLYNLQPHTDKNEENLWKSIVCVHNSRKKYIKESQHA